MSEGGSDFIQIVKCFLSFNILGERILGDDSDLGLFRLLNILKFITEDFFNLLNLDRFGGGIVPSSDSESVSISAVVDDEDVLFLRNWSYFNYFNISFVVLLL